MNRLFKEFILTTARQTLHWRGAPKKAEYIALPRLRDWGSIRLQSLTSRKKIYSGVHVVWPQEGLSTLENFEATDPEPGKILVRTDLSMISSGTERAIFNRMLNTSGMTQFPIFPGYCGVGEVVKVGDDVTRFKPGDQVAGFLPHASMAILREHQLHHVPAGLSAEEGVFMVLGSVALQGVRKARIRKGEEVAIMGLGIIGQLALQLAKVMGAGRAIGIARNQHKLEVARICGADALIALKQDDAKIEAVSVPVVIDATGNPAALELATTIAAPRGRIIFLGSNRGVTRQIDLDIALREKELTWIGAHGDVSAEEDPDGEVLTEAQEFDEFLKIAGKGHLKLKPLITHSLTPRDTGSFYRQLSLNDPTIIGAIIDWRKLPDSQRMGKRSLFALPKGFFARGVSAEWPEMVKASEVFPHIFDLQKLINSERLSGVMRFGIIGCGEIATSNANAIAEAPNTELRVVMDINPDLAQRLGKRFSVSYTTELGELLSREDIDVVFISVPHHLHAPIAIKAAEAGKHIIVEKPLAHNVKAAQEMVNAAKNFFVHLSVCFPFRYDPRIQVAREVIQQGGLGEILGIEDIFQAYKPISYWTGGNTGLSTSDWRGQRTKAGGGIGIMQLCHDLDLVRYITGLEVKHISASKAVLGSPVEVEDTISACCEYNNGAISTMSATYCTRGVFREVLSIWGQDGYIAIFPDLRIYSMHPLEGMKMCTWHSFTGLPDWDVRTVFIARFADRILKGESPDITGDDGLQVQTIIENAYESSEEQRNGKLKNDISGKSDE